MKALVDKEPRAFWKEWKEARNANAAAYAAYWPVDMLLRFITWPWALAFESR